jgi:3'-phosphoadenosine 5'-phosphosulfate sulfotransferase (PAPS reductase)/FAD synthetase
VTATPYTLPEGNVQIAFSGGRTSAYMLHQILAANGDLPDRVVVTFQNTGREMPETLDFVQEVGSRWGVEVVWLEYRADGERFERVSHNSASRSGEPFESLVELRGMLPNQNARFCSTELKVRTAKRYLRALGWDYWTNCVGIRADEAHRSTNPPKDRWTIWRPLVAAGVSKLDVASFWKRQPFDLRLPNIKGNCWLGNCDGCFLKSEANVAAFTRDYPDRAAWWEEMESRAAEMTSGRANQWSKRYARAELRNFIERQGDLAFSTEGLLCQADDGECTG